VGIVFALEAANVPEENEEAVTPLGTSNIKYVFLTLMVSETMDDTY